MSTWRFLGLAGAGLAAGAACLAVGAFLDLPIITAAGALICGAVIVARDVWLVGPRRYARGAVAIGAIIVLAVVAQALVGA